MPAACVNPLHEDPHGLTATCSISQADLDAVSLAVGGVLFNVSNFPDAVQTRLLGQDMAPLRERLTAAVLGAGLRLPAPAALDLEAVPVAIVEALYRSDAVLCSVPHGQYERYESHSRERAAALVRDALIAHLPIRVEEA